MKVHSANWKLEKCNCRKFTTVVPGLEDAFEAEMNKSCPAHEVRSLGRISSVVIEIIGGLTSSNRSESSSRRIPELLAKYNQHPEEARRSGRDKVRKELLAGAIEEP